jgi:serine beta-lactamase-like protein LACTB, mitochondrial
MQTSARSLISRAILLALFVAPSVAAQEFTGTWEGQLKMAFDPAPLQVRMGLERNDEGGWGGAFDADMIGPGLLEGAVERGDLQLQCDLGGRLHSLTLQPQKEGGLRGLFLYRGLPFAIDFERRSPERAANLHLEVRLPEERPTHVTLKGLSGHWLDRIDTRVNGLMDRQSAVGLAMAIAVDGELFDVRSWGWRDVTARKPVDGQTLFRWASISKSITGVVAAKLAETGMLDLDEDVRMLVPEFPEKEHVVSTRLLLGHLAGMPHYQHWPWVTRLEHDEEFPFRDPVRAIDMFRIAPLINQPGTEYSYSTHGYVLAGAVIERSTDQGYRAEVVRLVKEPLRMETLEPDDPTMRRADRTIGYRVAKDGRIFRSGDTDISWKLAGGGFQSTVADLARFGAGLGDEDYLSSRERKLLWTSQETLEGEQTGYGLGFHVGRTDGRLVVSHAGAQRRTATYLISFPDEGISVALMCNTEGVRLGALARNVARVIFEDE